MEWKRWEGLKVFIRTKSGKFYSGVVKEVADIGDGIIFISLIDKFGQWVSVTAKEIVELKEESDDSSIYQP